MPGDEWDDSIQERLGQARLILLLISADFLSSSYCCKEMECSLERHRSAVATVVPIILKPVAWEDTPVSVLQMLPKGGRPVSDWESIDKGLKDVALGIKEVVQKIRSTNPGRLNPDIKGGLDLPAEPVQMNASELQHRTIQLLETTGKFIDYANLILHSRQNNAECEKRKAIINAERRKAENPELSIAVVAAMKAGKSTIINTILGEKVLPSREVATTTIATEVALRPGVLEPVLDIGADIREGFARAEDKLKRTLSKYASGLDRELGAYPYLRNLASGLCSRRLGELPARITGVEQIHTTLNRLNDVARLLRLFLPEESALGELESLPRITASLWQPPGIRYQEVLGQLVIIDTPGPNEAGSPHLYGVVSRQLSNCSLVLLIMDFTQLQTDAEQRIRAEIEKVAELRGHENVYVLVNKVDQRGPGDLNPTDLVNLVVHSARLRGRDPASRVFEVSARQGLASSRLLQERRTSTRSPAESETARSLMQLVRPLDWEEQLPSVTWDEMDRMAKRVWERSGFARFLDGAISFLAEAVAPTVMQSALSEGSRIVAAVREETLLRSSAIKESTDDISCELAALDADLRDINSQRRSMEPSLSIKSLKSEIQKSLKLIHTEAVRHIEDEIQVIADTLADIQKRGAGALRWLSALTADMSGYRARTTKLDFTNKEAAISFAMKTAAHLTTRMQPFLERAMMEARNQLADARRRLTNELQAETEPIFKRLSDRLKRDFKVHRSLPVFRIVNRGLQLPPPRIEVRTVKVQTPAERVKTRPWYFLWLLEVETVVNQPARTERHFECRLSVLRDRATDALEEKFDELRKSIENYLDDRLSSTVEEFFSQANEQLESCRTILEDARQDHMLTRNEQLLKQKELVSLAGEAANLYDQFPPLSELSAQMLEKRRSL